MNVEQFSYLKCPSKIRAALINAGGPRLSIEAIERKLSTLPRGYVHGDVGEPKETDGFDFRVAGLVPAQSKPRTGKPRNRQNLARIKAAAKAANEKQTTDLRYVREKPTIAGTPFSEALIEEVCEALDVPQEVLLSSSRWWRLAAVRSLIVVLLRERNAGIYSYPRIARILGRGDHSTIIHSHQRFEHYCTIYPDVAALYLEMREGGE